jgi:thiol-disulfide isomerase/thioredoxin
MRNENRIAISVKRTLMLKVRAISRLWLLSLPVIFGMDGCAGAQTVPAGVAGRWDATVTIKSPDDQPVDVPFRFDIASDSGQVKGSFFDGDFRVTSSSGRFENGALSLTFDQYATVLKATLHGHRLEGMYERGSRGAPYPFHATRYVKPAESANAPAIAGEWRIATNRTNGEAAWRLIVRQSGPQVSAAILRIDGDTGTLTGTYQRDRFVLSHFSGARPALFELTLARDDSLEILQNGSTKLMAIRITDPRIKDMPEPIDPMHHTVAKRPKEPFSFSFADLRGQLISNTNPKFQGKVVVISITGSWCPNCHDEAPLLSELYKKYRGAGLEIVAFAFEEADQLKNPTRLEAFIKRYDLQYTVLLAGEPEQLKEKVPQAENLTAFPTMLFIGRDGRIRSTHAGFASVATGALHAKDKSEITATIEALLAENANPGR